MLVILWACFLFVICWDFVEKIVKYLIKLLILDKIGLYDVKCFLTETVFGTLLQGFCASSQEGETWDTFRSFLATNNGE